LRVIENNATIAIIIPSTLRIFSSPKVFARNQSRFLMPLLLKSSATSFTRMCEGWEVNYAPFSYAAMDGVYQA
jgi:hypothetical protein